MNNCDYSEDSVSFEEWLKGNGNNLSEVHERGLKTLLKLDYFWNSEDKLYRKTHCVQLLYVVYYFNLALRKTLFLENLNNFF